MLVLIIMLLQAGIIHIFIYVEQFIFVGTFFSFLLCGVALFFASKRIWRDAEAEDRAKEIIDPPKRGDCDTNIAERFNQCRNIKNHHDLTTGLFNRDYGIERIKKSVAFANAENREFYLFRVNIVDFDRLEITYGEVFGGIFIAEFSNEISKIIENSGYAIRTSNDEFLIFYDLNEPKALEKNAAICKKFENLYHGEAIELSLSIENVENLLDFSPKNNEPITSINTTDKGNLSTLMLELFERASHTGCAIKILLGLIGRLFALERVVVCTKDNKIVYKWGKNEKSPMGKNFSGEEIFCPDESPEIYRCVIHEQAVLTGSIIFIKNSDSWAENDKAILQNITKTIASYLNVEKSRFASLEKTRFLTKVSHEIRTPMNSIIGMINIALSAVGENNQQRAEDSLKKIDIAAKYLLSLINDILELSRIESGDRLRIENNTFSLNEFLSGIDSVIRDAIESNNISFNIVKNYEHDYVTGDENRIKQVLINLLGNASKFTNPGGTILFTIEELGLSPGGGTCAGFKFSVKDTGIGIPAEKQADIFMPFEQGDQNSKNQGTGLGLAISRNIITAMGSTIELTSEYGMGSEFSFILNMPFLQNTLPESTEKAEPKAAHDAPEQPDETGDISHFEGKSVLLVDDIDINLEIVAFILENVGFVVDVALNGQEALDKFFEKPPGHFDVILMDIQMPVMDGITAAKEIRKNTSHPDAKTIPIIALSANAFDEDSKKSVESGMNHHINKPINNKELLAVLRRLVK